MAPLIRRVAVSALAVGLAAGVLGTVGTGSVYGPAVAESRIVDNTVEVIPEAMPQTCASEYEMAVRRRADVSAVATQALLRFDGIPVRLTTEGWRRAGDRADQDPSWALWFHALVWLLPLADEQPGVAADLAVAGAAALPDPGPSAGSAVLQRAGWTSGTIRNRLVVIRCLYQVTDDPRLLAIGRELGDALLDPRRYPGWPRSKPHNHGILTNQVLIRAANTFDRPEWARVSKLRLRMDLPRVFSRCGMAFEQSTGYHALNVSLWSDFEDLARSELSRARFALGALVRPDGVLEVIGDGQARVGTPNAGRLWCAGAGWAANTVDGAHYILRFGPRTAGHGHADHGAMTWFTRGVPVLSDRGLFDKVRDARFAYAVSAAAHSVLEPVGVPGFTPSTNGVRLGPDAYRLRDREAGIARTRYVRFTGSTLIVIDTASAEADSTAQANASGDQRWIQHWHLAPGWQPTPTGARHPSGRELTLDCRGGSLHAVQVEAYPAWREVVPAWDLQCRASGDRILLRTTLTVR